MKKKKRDLKTLVLIAIGNYLSRPCAQTSEHETQNSRSIVDSPYRFNN
jgi:hypothetical protein